ncbi:Potassium-transporting ATPase C chain [Patulibacter medicamentivorans]|jgi:K+-transporting ATPase ATPase C chain|uniref:Potassium-transporting ATPase KdpC subunit n=1 Tax=Patulibacter medicamentivorans TaxID=1097667 RepID=H0E8T3_9ACTN|nr:potassium-transporting ATPase subunit C [Patulibacter medicamentivorans]EHN09888.1 Potassium-transporting ATPase C chain [Patulibacter medicamentivorans]
MRKDIVTSLIAVVAFTLLLGLAYPLAVTGISQAVLNDQADGSKIVRDGKVVGSKLIAQDFRKPVLDADGKPKQDADGNPLLAPDPRYFQPRPSVTGYAANATAFSNLGPNNVATRDAIAANAKAYLDLEKPYDPTLTVARIPVDAATNSASGVDPQISEANARIQARRIAAVRHLPADRVRQLIEDHTDGRALGILGEPGVNVLELNLALDRATTTDGATR